MQPALDVLARSKAAKYSLVPRLHSPAFLATCEKGWRVEPGNDAKGGQRVDSTWTWSMCSAN